LHPEAIIFEYYRPGSLLAATLLDHSRRVRDKALAVAAQVPHLQPDMDFIDQAALLHDIGILWTRAPSIHCHGELPYICHGVIGRRILAQYGLDKLGLVCERHVGVGIKAADITAQGLRLPLREMVPLSLEEIIVCYADKFFSKKCGGGQSHSLEAVRADLLRFGQDKVERFMDWHRQLNP
jgi:uncharacterized protein